MEIRKTNKSDMPLLSSLTEDLPETFSKSHLQQLLKDGLIVNEGAAVALFEPFGPDILLIRGLVVGRQHRYKKIGRGLLKEVHALALDRGFSDTFVLLRRDKKKAEKIALEFFLQSGYEVLFETGWSLVLQKRL